MQILGRLKQNVSLQQAQTGLQPWFKSMLAEDLRRTNVSRASAEQRQRFLASTLELTPAPQGHSVLRQGLSRPLWVLFVATAVLLALACLNVRSEEHTSELQSQSNLVCRLLLEKKKKII